MSSHRYWRMTGFAIYGNGLLELSEARLYAAGILADASATLSCSFSPTVGSLTDLKDGLSTGVVAWTFAAHSSSGFALVWDFGSAGAADVNGIQLGAGNSATTFPIDLMIQYSDDALVWTTLTDVVGAKYPGVLTLTSESSASYEPFYSRVSLLLHCDGANGSITFTDSSLFPKPTGVTGGAQLSTAQSKFGNSSLKIASVADSVNVAFSNNLDLSAGSYTIEGWVNATAITNGDYHNLVATGNNVFPNRWMIDFGPTAGSVATLRIGGFSNSPIYTSGNGDYVIGTWAHFAAVNDSAANTFKFFLNGVIIGSRAAVALAPVAALQIGKNSDAWNSSAYYIDDVRVTLGTARYTDNFVPPNTAFSEAMILATDVPSPARWRRSAVTYERFPGASFPIGAASSHLREHPFFDAYNGGIGILFGTIKEKSTPTNTPLSRRVLLVDERSQMTIRETWSDAITGSYEFHGVKEGLPYTVLSYDNTGVYRAVVADGQIPELMA